jgi:hypothetical protein
MDLFIEWFSGMIEWFAGLSDAYKIIAITIAVTIPFLAQFLGHIFAIRREPTSAALHPLQIAFFEAKQLAFGGIAELRLRPDQRHKENSIYATIKIVTVRSWDFPNGDTSVSLESFVPSQRTPCLLIAPDNDSTVTTNLVFNRDQDGWKELMLRLYTDHLIIDKYVICVGLTVFMLKITVSAQGFSDYTTTAMVKLAGGSATVILAKGITQPEFVAQQAVARTILQAVENGAHIDPSVQSQLAALVCASYE